MKIKKLKKFKNKLIVISILGAVLLFQLKSEVLSQHNEIQNNVTEIPDNVQASPAATKLPIPRKLKSSYVNLLKKQADDKKNFYENQSREKKELKRFIKEETNKLLSKHREARSKFMTEKHTGEERRAFYLGQRNEMANLKHDLKEKQIQLTRDHKERLKDFQNSQKVDRKQSQDNK